jgi:hypothetical protein
MSAEKVVCIGHLHRISPKKPLNAPQRIKLNQSAKSHKKTPTNSKKARHSWHWLSHEKPARMRALTANSTTPHAARRELAVADQVLAARERLAVTAARAAPTPYIRAELGERPSDPAKRKVWNRAVADIESFRLRNGIKDPKRALGREVERTAQQERRRQAQRQIREANRQLGRGEFATRSRSIE